MKTWEELLTESDKHAQQSKPEKLAIIDILYDSPNIPVSTIFETFKAHYKDISVRQVRYYIESLIEDKLIFESNDGGTEKLYCIINPADNLVSPISAHQSYLLIIVAAIYVYTQAIGTLLLVLGVILSITVHQLEYQYSLKDYSNFIKFKIINHFNDNKSP